MQKSKKVMPKNPPKKGVKPPMKTKPVKPPPNGSKPNLRAAMEHHQKGKSKIQEGLELIDKIGGYIPIP